MHRTSLICLILSTLLGGCTILSPALIEALSRDHASFCVLADTRGGLGSLIAPSGGYGQATLTLCRSQMPNARLELHTDGTIIIEHGAQ